MEFRGIRQTSHIGGENRNPSVTEHLKFLQWDNNLSKIKYTTVTGLGPNTKLNDGYVYNGDSSVGAKYVWKLDSNNNPLWRKEDFLVSVSRQSGSNSALFVMNDSATKTLPLGALAWLDTINSSITLPGNTKILFDDNNTVGGDLSFTFDKTNKLLNLTGFTGIQVKNNSDSTYQGVFQYFGGNNILLAHGITRTQAWGGNLLNTIAIGETAGGSVSLGSNNLFLGHYSATNASSVTSGAIYLGNYSGRLETENNKFYVGNTNYTTLSDARLGSLLYGDFSTGHIKINNRLEIGQEAKIGSFNIANTPSWGMLQFIGTGTPDEYKPQYHDGFNWVDFATGANNYLISVTKDMADVGTVSNDYKLTFTLNGLPDLNIQLGSNAFNSDVIPQASPDLVYGYLQVSSGDNADYNRGFTHSTSLQWSELNKRLFITGDVALGSTSLTGTLLGNIKFDGSHYYGYGKNDLGTGTEWRILDSTGSGEINDGINVGTGAGLIYRGKDINKKIEFKTIATGDSRFVVTNNANDVTLLLSLDIEGYAVPKTTVASPTTNWGNIYQNTTDPTSVAPKINFKPLVCADGTVIINDTGTEILLSATVGGAPISYTASNLGSGVGLYKQLTVSNFEFKTLNTLSDGHIVITANTDGQQLDLSTDDIVITNLGTGLSTISASPANSFLLDQKTFIDGVAITAVDDGDEIHFDVNKSIPKITPTAIISPEFIPGVAPGNGVLVFNSEFSSDIRTIGTTTKTAFHSFTVGTGLYYDSVSRILTATSSTGASSDYILSHVDKIGNTLSFVNSDLSGGGIDQWTDFTFGALAFLDYVAIPVATYADSVPAHYGGIMVDRSGRPFPLGTYDSLGLDEITGEMSYLLNPVTYLQQYPMHGTPDEDVTARGFARDNIQAAYINGINTEDFIAKDSECDNLTVNTLAAIQNVEISGVKVTTNDSSISIELSKNTNAGVAPSRVEVTAGGVNIYVNQNQGVGNVSFYSVDDVGTNVRIAFLDGTGNLHLKGQLIARDTSV